MKYRICDEHNYGDKKVTIFNTEIPEAEASLAFTLIEKWGVVAATVDGEDSSGRARTRLLTPDEVVLRAFDVAEKALKTARERNLMLALPDLNEINAERDAARIAKAIEKAKAA